MIVDCHTHIWSTPQQLGKPAESFLSRQGVRSDIGASPADHALTTSCVDKTLVLGFTSRHLGARVPNDLIADYVGRHSQHVIGIAGIDPTDDAALDQAEALLDRWEFRGLTISPAAQNFHPCDSRVLGMYEMANRRRVPMMVHNDVPLPAGASMQFARPFLLDEIASCYPQMPVVVASMGFPWVQETLLLAAKHDNVYTDIAALLRRPWAAYNALVLAHQLNVMDKLLFGSDFPFYTAAEAIETIYRLHEMCHGTHLPTVPRESLRAIVERNALIALGIARPDESMPAAAEETDEVE